MTQAASALVIAGLTLTLAACAGPTSYASPEALKEAYVDAGGNCDNPIEMGEDMLSEGAHGIACGDPITMLIVFDTEDAKNRYLARTGGTDGWSTFGGERWLASGESDEVISKLGGAAVDR